MRGKADSHDISFLQQVYSILGQRFRVSNPLKLALLTGIRITGIIISSVLRSKTKASPLCVGSSEKPPCCPLLSNVPLRVIPPVLHIPTPCPMVSDVVEVKESVLGSH